MWRRFGFRFARRDTWFHVMNVFNSILVPTAELADSLIAPLFLLYPIIEISLLHSSQLFAFRGRSPPLTIGNWFVVTSRLNKSTTAIACLSRSIVACKIMRFSDRHILNYSLAMAIESVTRSRYFSTISNIGDLPQGFTIGIRTWSLRTSGWFEIGCGKFEFIVDRPIAIGN